MTSDLKRRAGFGWGAVVALTAMLAIAAIGSGIIRIAAASAALLVLVFMGYQWRKWNKYGWQQAHFRGMLLYSAIAGSEAAHAEQEGRPFDKARAL